MRPACISIGRGKSASILKRLADMKMGVFSGGSSANTLAGVKYWEGADYSWARWVRRHGDTYIGETEKTGVKTGIGIYDCISGHAITFITPGSERTFATHLGAALNFSEKDVHEDDIASAKILHLEGYLFESDGLYAACLRAMDFARAHGVAVSIDLSDPALIDRYMTGFTGQWKNAPISSSPTRRRPCASRKEGEGGPGGSFRNL
jgi:sugar/nucleoside kinase (ribokinase family)